MGVVVLLPLPLLLLVVVVVVAVVVVVVVMVVNDDDDDDVAAGAVVDVVVVVVVFELASIVIFPSTREGDCVVNTAQLACVLMADTQVLLVAPKGYSVVLNWYRFITLLKRIAVVPRDRFGGRLLV